MEKRRRIVLFGNSLILGTVGASLGRSAGYEVISLLLAQANELRNLSPDVVLFDLEACPPAEMFSLSDDYSRILFVGVSPDNNMVKVWSSSQLRELSTKDLMGVIDSQPEDVPAEIREGGADGRGNDSSHY